MRCNYWRKSSERNKKQICLYKTTGGIAISVMHSRLVAALPLAHARAADSMTIAEAANIHWSTMIPRRLASQTGNGATTVRN
jgi:hypothetical protein